MGSSLFRKLLLDDSNENEIIKEVVMDLTSRKCRSYIRRNHLASHERLYLGYFANSLVYPKKVFQRRFQMNHFLFLNIISKVEVPDPYFVQKRNGGKKLGLSSFQKITAALRMLAHRVMGDFMDEYVRIEETTVL